jgi:hypothetical protein
MVDFKTVKTSQKRKANMGERNNYETKAQEERHYNGELDHPRMIFPQI